MRILALLLAICLTSNGIVSADLTSRDRAIIKSINGLITKAGRSFQEGKYDESGKTISEAMRRIHNAVGAGSPDLYDALLPSMQRIGKAHTMLEFEGVSLPPFRTPKRPEPKVDPKPTPGDAPMDPNMISFSKQVAPILAGKCGNCHTTQSRGGFNLATFESLMKGPPEGVVIFAGDTVGSRLIETIETGDMPRGGGRVSPAELKLLKDWIIQGAKFDGEDPKAPIGGGAAPAATPNRTRPMVRRSTGKETVSFASDIAPLLVDNCNGCHIDAMQTRGGLRMDTFAQMLRGGDSGDVIVPGRGEQSLLVQKLRGQVGQRMPAGGRPALSEESIKLISTWIDEGATLDGASENQPLRVMSQLAWAAAATPEEMSSRRKELAGKNMRLVLGGSGDVKTKETDHFLVMGAASQGTIDLVAKEAEANMKLAESVVRTDSGEGFYRGRATIFVMPRRYDYSEFAKMVEGRGIPSAWTSHWGFDGIDAYIAMVASDRDEEEAIAARLSAPVVSLAVATRGQGLPRWLAEGVGRVTAARQGGNSRDRNEKARQEAELSEALASVNNAKQFLDGKLSPEQSDRVATAIAASMLDRSYRRSFDGLLRSLQEGAPFDQAFMQSFRMPAEAFVGQWLKYARGG